MLGGNNNLIHYWFNLFRILTKPIFNLIKTIAEPPPPPLHYLHFLHHPSALQKWLCFMTGVIHSISRLSGTVTMRSIVRRMERLRRRWYWESHRCKCFASCLALWCSMYPATSPKILFQICISLLRPQPQSPRVCCSEIPSWPNSNWVKFSISTTTARNDTAASCLRSAPSRLHL